MSARACWRCSARLPCSMRCRRWGVPFHARMPVISPAYDSLLAGWRFWGFACGHVTGFRRCRADLAVH